MERTVIDITRVTILKENIKYKLWLELVLTMIYIKTSYPIKVLANNLTSHKAHFCEKPDLLHVQILGLTIYILFHKEEHTMKSEKWVS